MCETDEKFLVKLTNAYLGGQGIRSAICQEGRGGEKLCGLVVARESKGSFNGRQSFTLRA